MKTKKTTQKKQTKRGGSVKAVRTPKNGLGSEGGAKFISFVTHQLRTPLTGIKWFTSMVMGGDAGKLNKDQKYLVTNINELNEKMIRLVNELLNVSRIESGRVIIAPKPVNLSEIVKEKLVDLKKQIKEKNIRVVLQSLKNVPEVSVDPDFIAQAYIHLLSNAIKFSQKGGVIHVIISRKNNMIQSEIRDEGCGVPKKEYRMIFQQFFIGEKNIKNENTGNGLGLYFVKSIVETMKGKIWFKSKENVGTSFFFTIPVEGMQPKKGEVVLGS